MKEGLVMGKKAVIEALKEFGLTEYESRIYSTLLKDHPLNGNVIANLSGVPGPKVYEALRKMNNQGLIFTVEGEGNKRQKRYSPLPYKQLLESKKSGFMDNYHYLDEELTKITSLAKTNWTELFTVEGYSSSLDVIKAAITESESSIFLSCWKDEYEALRKPLLEAHKRGINIVSIIFDESTIDVPWRNFNHVKEEGALKRHNGEFAIVTDESKAMIMESLHEAPHSVISTHPIMVTTTLNYIRHDIYVNRILIDFSKEMKSYYGKKLENLINDF